MSLFVLMVKEKYMALNKNFFSDNYVINFKAPVIQYQHFN